MWNFLSPRKLTTKTEKGLGDAILVLEELPVVYSGVVLMLTITTCASIQITHILADLESPGQELAQFQWNLHQTKLGEQGL